MTSTTRVAVATLAVLALTGVTAAADAKPGHGHHGHHGRTTGEAYPHVLKALGRLEQRIAHATRDSRLSHLTPEDAAALQANATADEAAVQATADAYSAAPDDATLAAAKGVLKSYRPRVYVVATNIVRHSERLAAEITDLQGEVTPGSTDETDLATASGLLATVSASAFTSTTDGTTVHAAQHAVAQAQALVGQVEADLAAG